LSSDARLLESRTLIEKDIPIKPPGFARSPYGSHRPQPQGFVLEPVNGQFSDPMPVGDSIDPARRRVKHIAKVMQ
jgi:hypothetical protein